MKRFIKYMSLGAELTGLIVVSVFIGLYVGEKLGSRNLGAFWAIVISFSIWVYRIILMTKEKK